MYAQQEGTRRTVTLHDGQELDNDLGAGPDQDLALARLLGVVDGVERIVKDGGLGHIGGMERFSDGDAVEVSAVQDYVSLHRPESAKSASRLCPKVLQLIVAWCGSIIVSQKANECRPWLAGGHSFC